MLKIVLCLLLLLSPVAGAEDLNELLKFDPVGLTIGKGLIPLVEGQNPPLFAGVKRVREQLSEEQGLTLPGVRFRDDRSLAPFEYVVFVREIEVARGTVNLNSLLAVPKNPSALASLKGPAGLDPMSGMAGRWIAAADKAKALKSGCQVYTPAETMLRQLKQVALSRGDELFNRQEMLRGIPPLLAGALSSDMAAQDRCLRVCQNLFQERVPVQSSVVEMVLDPAQAGQDADSLSEKARQAVKEQICARVALNKTIPAATLGAALQARLRPAVRFAPEGLTIADAAACEEALQAPVQRAVAVLKGQPVLCVPDDLRLAVHRLTRRQFPQLTVLGQSEIAKGYTLQKALEI